MSGFKLLAIRPLVNCDQRFSKNLLRGSIYKFYNNYIFLNTKGEILTPEDYENELNSERLEFNVDSVLEENKVQDSIYDIVSADGQHINVNISAIVGKNGSGKSSLMELLYASIYVLSTNEKILTPNMESLAYRKTIIEKNAESNIALQTEIVEQEKQKIFEKLTHLKHADFIEANQLENLRVNFEIFSERSKIRRETEENVLKNLKDVEQKQQDIANIRRQLNVELYYEIDQIIFKLSIMNGEAVITVMNINQINLENKTHILRDITIGKIIPSPLDFSDYFFYTIAVNYSHYGLNSSFLGNWITSLFHKNDGYKTPIVITPMRMDGDYKINKEIKFAKYRLLSNVLIGASTHKKGKIFITEKQYIHKIRFRINNSKMQSNVIKDEDGTLSGSKEGVSLIADLYGIFYPLQQEVSIGKSNNKYINLISNYLIRKVSKISNTYEGFYEGYNFFRKDTRNSEFLNKIKNENSHVTNKLKQALNFLIHNDTNEKKFQDYLISGVDFIDFSLQELIEWMGDPEPFDIINHIPPSIFEFEILLKENNNPNSTSSTFNDLSSGEQQMIHSVQAVIYHLNNIQSVHYGAVSRLTYRSINIIFDEIELYFHPEYQRRFLNNLLNAIKKIYFGPKNGIRSINIQFLTHSPFILSDIPSNNVAKLDRGVSKVLLKHQRTFGANIHELLTQSFFMDSTIGDFALSKIENIVNFYYEVLKSPPQEKYKLIERYNRVAPEFKFIVNNIGEDVTRTVLEDHLQFIEDTLIEVKL